MENSRAELSLISTDILIVQLKVPILIHNSLKRNNNGCQKRNFSHTIIVFVTIIKLAKQSKILQFNCQVLNNALQLLIKSSELPKFVGDKFENLHLLGK